MASTFSDLKFELIGTGDQAGNWGQTTNDNIGTAIEQAITGLGNPVFATDADLTLSFTDTVALQTARALVLNTTSTGSLTATRQLIVPTIEKQYIVQNNTTGSQSITVKTAAGTGITVPNGAKMHLYVNGVNVVDAVTHFSTLTLGSALPVTSGGTGVTNPSLVQGTNVTISGTWPNQTINSTASGTGDVVGPASSTDNAITRFDTTTGKLVQNSLVTVADDGAIVAPQAGSVVPFYFANQAAFPSANTYHGAVAHSHADGAMFFAHGGVWTRLLDALTTVTVAQGGTGTTTPSLVAGTNVTITGTWPNQTIASSGGGGGGALLENDKIISENFVVGAGKNALAVGPVTISTGNSVTVGSGQKWLVLTPN